MALQKRLQAGHERDYRVEIVPMRGSLVRARSASRQVGDSIWLYTELERKYTELREDLVQWRINPATCQYEWREGPWQDWQAAPPAIPRSRAT